MKTHSKRYRWYYFCKLALGAALMLAGILLPVSALSAPSSRWIATSNGGVQFATQPSPAFQDYDGTTSGLVQIDHYFDFQQIDGWGGCFNELGWRALTRISQQQRTEIMKSLFDTSGCNFTICRMAIGASDFGIDWYSLNETANDFTMNNFSIERDKGCMIPYIKAAMAFRPDLRIWGSPWCPPTWMKTNKNYSGGRFISQPDIQNAYSLYFSKYIKAYRAEGVNVYAIHVQNEPTSSAGYPACVWTGEQMRDFIRDYLGPRFKNDNLDAEIWLGTINDGTYAKFAGCVYADSVASSYTTGTGYQWAGKGAIAETWKKHPDKKLMQTETECGSGNNDWGYGSGVFDLMLSYLSGGANSYMQWNMVLQSDGMSSWGWKQSAMVSVDTVNKSYVLNPQFYAAKHFSYFVPPGSHRVRTRGTVSQQMAFRKPDGTVVVVVRGGSGSTPLTIKIGNKMIKVSLPASSFNTFELSGLKEFDSQKPGTPADLQSTASQTTSATLAWTGSADNTGIREYLIFNNQTIVARTDTAPLSAAMTFTVPGLKPGSAYSFSVKAIDLFGNMSDPSNQLSLTTPGDNEPPTAPEQLSADNITSNSCELVWKNSSDNSGIAGYEIFSGTSLLKTVDGSGCVVGGLSAATGYFLTVKARDIAGNYSAASNEVRIVTQEQGPTYDTCWGVSDYEYIRKVEFGPFSFQSGQSDYSNFTGRVMNLMPGSTISFTLTPSNQYNEYWKAWIDYNRDGDFEDPGEEVVSKSGTSAQSGTFTVSSGVTVAKTRIRVAMCSAKAPKSSGEIGNGEVEDYTVSFSASGINLLPGEIPAAFELKLLRVDARKLRFCMAVPASGNIAIVIRNVKGQTVLRSLHAISRPGIYPVTVDLDRKGPLSAGVLCLSVHTGGREQAKKLFVVR